MDSDRSGHTCILLLCSTVLTAPGLAATIDGNNPDQALDIHIHHPTLMLGCAGPGLALPEIANPAKFPASTDEPAGEPVQDVDGDLQPVDDRQFLTSPIDCNA